MTEDRNRVSYSQENLADTMTELVSSLRTITEECMLSEGQEPPPTMLLIETKEDGDISIQDFPNFEKILALPVLKDAFALFMRSEAKNGRLVGFCMLAPTWTVFRKNEGLTKEESEKAWEEDHKKYKSLSQHPDRVEALFLIAETAGMFTGFMRQYKTEGDKIIFLSDWEEVHKSDTMNGRFAGIFRELN